MTRQVADVSYLLSDGTLVVAQTTVDVTSATSPGMPGQVVGKTIIGMSTDDFATRMTELGRPIGADHFFVGSWNPAEYVQKAQQAHSRGLLPYGNMKCGSWSAFAGSTGDAMVADLGERLAALDYPVRVNFHHEPGFHSPTDNGEAGTAQQWVAMGVRQYPRLKSIAPKVITGGVINGFIMSPKTSGQGWTFDELDQLFTDEYLSAIDAFGGDYYDGATSRTSGEPAVLKVARCDQWLTSRGYEGCADIGEFQFVRPKDCDDLAAFLTSHADRWWCALAFNSDDNNRSGIPTIGAGWNLSHGYDTPTDRRDAMRRMLDHPLTHP